MLTGYRESGMGGWHGLWEHWWREVNTDGGLMLKQCTATLKLSSGICKEDQ